MDRHIKHSLIGLLVVALVALLAPMGFTALDFIQGHQIPTTLQNSYTFTGTNTFSGPLVSTGGIAPAVASKTASFTLSDTVDMYHMNSSTGAITVTLPTPSTMTSGNTWVLCLETAGNAVTLNAGTFSINGAVTDAQMDAAGDCEFITVDPAGYYLIAKNIH